MRADRSLASRRRAPGRSTAISPVLLRRWPLPPIDGAAGKDGRGNVLIVGGSEQIPGAVILAAIAALRAGAGKLTVATCRSVAPLVATAVPEARVVGLKQSADGELRTAQRQDLQQLAAGCDAVLIGPGVMSPNAGAALFDAYREPGAAAPLIVDAGSLTGFKRRRKAAPRGTRAVITPHAGEMADLTGLPRATILADPPSAAREVADQLGVTVVLKGAETHIAAAHGAAFHNTAGNLGLGTSGSGDVLAGLIAGLCARGADPVQAAVWGVFVHAKAGETLAASVAPLGFLARELLPELPRLLARFRSAR